MCLVVNETWMSPGPTDSAALTSGFTAAALRSVQAQFQNYWKLMGKRSSCENSTIKTNDDLQVLFD